MRDTILNQLADFLWRHARLVLLVSALIAAAGAWYSHKYMRLNADTNDLIAKDRPFMDDFRAMMKEFGDTEYINVVVDSKGNTAQAEAAVDALTEQLRTLQELPGVFSAVEPKEQLRIATRAMSDSELEGFTFAAGSFPALKTGDLGVALKQADDLLSQLIEGGRKMDPQIQRRLGGAAIFALKAVASAKQASESESELAMLLPQGLKRQYFKSDTGRMFFIDVMPVKNYGSLSVIEEPLQRIRAIIDTVHQQHPAVDIGLTGKPVLQADEMSTTSQDMTKASLIAFALCCFLYLLLIGGIKRPLLLVLAFAIGAAWTYGGATLVVGQLNLLSIVFMLVLIGVGMDYGVHVIARYQEHRRLGEDPLIAMRAAFQTAVRGNVTGAITSSSVFFMALFTTFQGLRELGLIAGGGLLLCLAAMTIVLPALLAVFDHGPVKIRQPLAEEESSSEGILHFMITWPATVLVLAAVFSIGMALFVPRVRFEQNLLKLQAESLESIDWEHRVMADSASNTWFGAVITNDIQQIPTIIAKAAEQPAIGTVRSVLDVIKRPTPQREAWRKELHSAGAGAATQPDAAQSSRGWTLGDLRAPLGKLDLIAAGAESEAPAEAARLKTLAADLRALGREMEEDSRGGDVNAPSGAKARINGNVAAIGASLQLMLDGDALPLREAMPDGVRQRFVSPGGKFLVMLHPRKDVWEFEPMGHFIEALRAVDPHATGVPITHFESLNDMRNAFERMAYLAFFCVALLVWLDFRSIKDVILAMIPLSIAMLWTFGLMGVFDVPFNLANFFSVPIILGLGVAGSVQILHRYHEGGPTRLSLGATRRAVVLSSLTTIAGFGALLIAHHRGLRSLGLAMTLGMTGCMLTSLVILPATLALLEQRGWGNSKSRRMHTP